MMEKLLILGAGQYADVVREIAEETDRFEKIAFLDDRNPNAIGMLSDAVHMSGEFTHAIVAIGDSAVRMHWLTRLSECGFCVAPLISARACVARDAVLSDGCVVEPMAVIQPRCVVGKGCLISAGAVLRHGAILQDGCHVDCNAVVMSEATVAYGTSVPCGEIYGTKENGNV